LSALALGLRSRSRSPALLIPGRALEGALPSLFRGEIRHGGTVFGRQSWPLARQPAMQLDAAPHQRAERVTVTPIPRRTRPVGIGDHGGVNLSQSPPVGVHLGYVRLRRLGGRALGLAQ